MYSIHNSKFASTVYIRANKTKNNRNEVIVYELIRRVTTNRITYKIKQLKIK